MGQKATALNEFLGAEYCRGDFCGRPIRINRRPSPSTAVGARAVGSGREGLYGRPRPVHLASILRNTTTPHPAGDHKGPPNPTSSSLAPTDHLYIVLFPFPVSSITT